MRRNQRGGSVGEWDMASQIKQTVLDVIDLGPYIVGWLVGKLVLAVQHLGGAIKAGYLDAIGEESWREYQKRQH